MNNRDKTALALALAIVGGIAAGLRCDASEWVENSSQTNPRGAAYTVKTYTEGSDPLGHRYDKESILWQSSLTLSYAKGICAMGSEKF